MALEVDELLALVEQKNAPEVDVAGIHFTVGRLGESAKLMAQREKLLILFENLIYNAISFTPPGGNLSITPRLEGASVVIEVSDTGCGIAPGHLPHVFEQFYTTRGQTSEGSGLGLYICKLTVEELGGSIEAASTLDAGAVFTIRLPIQ
ncbi:Adaptive-response sensory-kinase SasA [bioreactor metagenome]|uniref:histidine kinase n=1 Tax=bioreactor metagenome TaxID=1076179 RepID=A0A645G0A9_9ZZZZ